MTSTTSTDDNFRTGGAPAPGNLIYLHGFLNTWSDELDIEDLATPAEAKSWLADAGLWTGQGTMTDADHQQLLSFRGALREAARDDEHLEALFAATAHITFNLAYTRETVALVPATPNSVEKVIGQLMAIVYNSIANGTWARFKCCALPSCGWAYYDKTRSRTRRWCSMQTCGSRHKAREYYKRNR